MKFSLVFLCLCLTLPLYAADVMVAPGEKIPCDVSGTVLLLAGEHTTDETVEITTSMTLTAEPDAVWTSSANPAIAVHADDVTIRDLVLKSADPTATAIVSGSPIALKRQVALVRLEKIVECVPLAASCQRVER